MIHGDAHQVDRVYTEFGKAKFAVNDRSLDFYRLSWESEDTLRRGMDQLDFVSGYGMSNPFEDFAECHNMYLHHRDVFAYLGRSSTVLQAKYDYFDSLYQTHKLSANFNPEDLDELSDQFRPWDSTRM